MKISEKFVSQRKLRARHLRKLLYSIEHPVLVTVRVRERAHAKKQMMFNFKKVIPIKNVIIKFKMCTHELEIDF